MRAILSAELAALVDLSAAAVAADETSLARCLQRALADADPARVEETILQSYLFLGFPVGLEVMKLWREVAGPVDGGETDADPAETGGVDDWLERGEEVCRRVYGANYEKLRGNVAEIHPALGSQTRCDEFLIDWQLDFVPSSRESAALAGANFAKHLARGGRQGRVVADFLIAAHAQLHTDRLIARDRGYLRDYFQGLTVLDPSASPAL